MEEIDEEDEVVEEFDVFLSKNLSNNLYLLQYPTTHFRQTYSADQRHVARIKPQHKKLEMDIRLDVSSPNYDQGKGEQIAVNVDGGASGDGMTYENSVMDYQVFSSRHVPQVGSRFAAAVVQDNQLHLTPISQVMQMQPSFKYVDHAEKRAVHAAKMKAQVESGQSSQDEADDAKAVTIRFKSAETEASRVLREKSYSSYEKRLFQEKWVPATVHHKNDSYSDRERNRLFCVQAFSSLDDAGNYPEMTVNPFNYFKTLVPHYSITDVDSETSPENVLSIAKLKFLPLGDQLKLLMKNAKIMHFSHLLALLPSNPDANSVVRSLQSFAVLVRGCWIVKSDVLYPPDTTSPISGLSADHICKVRDFILCLFNEREFLVRREVARQVNISSEEVKLILEQIARMKIGFGWMLKLPFDKSFVAQYPEVQERQSMVWASRYKQLLKRFSAVTETLDPMPKPSASKPKSSSKTPKTPSVVKKSRRTSQSSKTKSEISENELNGLKPFLSPPRATAEESKVIVDHAVVDINNHDAIDLNPVFSTSFNGFRSNTVVNDISANAETGSSNIKPFVKPSAVGIDCANGSQTTYTELNNVSFDPNLEFDGHSVNMDNVNATVALVADQMRQQVIDNNMFNSNEPSL